MKKILLYYIKKKISYIIKKIIRKKRLYKKII